MLLNINDPEILKMIVELESAILMFSGTAVFLISGWLWKGYKNINESLNKMLAIKKYEEDQRLHNQEHTMLQDRLDLKFKDLTTQITEYRFETISSISSIKESIGRIETKMATIVELYEQGKIKID